VLVSMHNARLAPLLHCHWLWYLQVGKLNNRVVTIQDYSYVPPNSERDLMKVGSTLRLSPPASPASCIAWSSCSAATCTMRVRKICSSNANTQQVRSNISPTCGCTTGGVASAHQRQH
jgi:hypothetical protein